MGIDLHVKYPKSLADFRKLFKYKISRKSVQWDPSCSTWTDGQTDMAKLTVNYRNFSN